MGDNRVLLNKGFLLLSWITRFNHFSGLVTGTICESIGGKHTNLYTFH
jgi:hypothetical protein